MTGRIILLSFSWLLIAAHFSRAENNLLVIISLAIPFLLFIKKRWSLVAVQVLTLCGALVWLFTTYNLIKSRIAVGEDWTRMAIILVAVAILTIVSGLLLGSAKIKERYR